MELDEVTLSGESVITDSDLEDTASSNFSDASIKDRLMDATKYIVARVRAAYLDNFTTTVTPTDFESPYDDTSPKILRLLGGRVAAEDSGGTAIDCTRRTFAAHLKMENQRGVNADENYPVFVFQDFELLIENGTSNPLEAEAIRVPDNKYGDVTALPDIFEGAVVQHAVFSCFETLRLTEEATNAKKRLDEELREYRLPFRSTRNQKQQQQEQQQQSNN